MLQHLHLYRKVFCMYFCICCHCLTFDALRQAIRTKYSILTPWKRIIPTGASSGYRTLTQTKPSTGFWWSGTSSLSLPYFLAVGLPGLSSGNSLRRTFWVTFKKMAQKLTLFRVYIVNCTWEPYYHLQLQCTQNFLLIELKVDHQSGDTISVGSKHTFSRPQPHYTCNTLWTIRHDLPDHAAASYGQHALPYLPVWFLLWDSINLLWKVK